MKNLPQRYDGKSTFQTIAIELCRQSKTKTTTTKKTLRFVIVSTGIVLVAKIDDEVSVLSVIKTYSSFSLVFSAVPKRAKSLKILKVMWLFWKFLERKKSLIRSYIKSQIRRE